MIQILKRVRVLVALSIGWSTVPRATLLLDRVVTNFHLNFCIRGFPGQPLYDVAIDCYYQHRYRPQS